MNIRIQYVVFFAIFRATMVGEFRPVPPCICSFPSRKDKHGLTGRKYEKSEGGKTV